jgi:hypothetical protein
MGKIAAFVILRRISEILEWKVTQFHHHWQDSPFWSTALEDSTRFHLVFTSLDFVTIFFTEQDTQPCVQPPNLRTRFLYLFPPVTGWPSYIPPSTGFPFCRILRLAGLRWRYSNPPPHWDTQRRLIGHSFYRGNFLRKSCVTCREKCRRRLMRLLSTWCRAVAFFSASGSALSQEVPTVKWMSNQPVLWTSYIFSY